MPQDPPFAVVSCDIDTVDRHLQGYGFEDLPPCDLVYRTAVPRLLELLADLGVPAVFFVIARDAEPQQTLLRQVCALGHEVASHSMTHPQPFSTLEEAALDEEISASRARLTAACGREVRGFRAPAWDVNDRVLGFVRRAGYQYDASVFPTPALMTSRWTAYRRSAGKSNIFAMEALQHSWAPVRPHRLNGAGAGLTEFPIAVTPWLRFPVYHTLTYFVPDWIFSRALRSLLRSRLPVCYELHAADLLDLDGDRVDRRMQRHPGMNLPLAEKLQRLRSVLGEIAAARRVLTYTGALQEGLVP
jgi:peptidoglycan/xylan/chitin deacetylase (PgdA/CDA1 family)